MKPNLTPEEMDAIAVLGFLSYEQGKSADASIIFKGLIALDDRRHHGYAGLGAIALREENLDTALDYLQKAAARKPDDVSVRANLGEALLRLARFDEALAEFHKVLTLDPNSRDMGTIRARALLQGMDAAVRALKTVS